MQASQTTAQGLWIGAGIGILMGTAIWFLGPPAMQGKAHIPRFAVLFHHPGFCLFAQLSVSSTSSAWHAAKIQLENVASGFGLFDLSSSCFICHICTEWTLHTAKNKWNQHGFIVRLQNIFVLILGPHADQSLITSQLEPRNAWPHSGLQWAQTHRFNW